MSASNQVGYGEGQKLLSGVSVYECRRFKGTRVWNAKT